METKHTPTPWAIYIEPIADKEHAKRELSALVDGTPDFKPVLVYISGPNGLAPAITGCGACSEANAALIVQAVNERAALVDALREIKAVVSGGNNWSRSKIADICDAALTKAGAA